jgi:hypothetical protein
VARLAKVTDALSPEGRRVMVQGFAAQKASAWIAQAIKDATGETVAERTIARRAAEWRAEVERRRIGRERMEDLVAAMKAGGMDASEQIMALAQSHLMEHPDSLTGADPIELQGLALEGEKTRLKKRELEIRERNAAVQERKMALMEERDRRVREVMEKPAEKMTPEQRIEEIRSIYGIA